MNAAFEYESKKLKTYLFKLAFGTQ